MKTDNFEIITVVKITGSKHPLAKFETYKYWEILGELLWRGVERFKAMEIAKNVRKAEPGTEIRLAPDIVLKVKRKGS